jgi:hypothetical protein
LLWFPLWHLALSPIVKIVVGESAVLGEHHLCRSPLSLVGYRDR